MWCTHVVTLLVHFHISEAKGPKQHTSVCGNVIDNAAVFAWKQEEKGQLFKMWNICGSQQLSLFPNDLSVGRQNKMQHNLNITPIKTVTSWFLVVCGRCRWILSRHDTQRLRRRSLWNTVWIYSELPTRQGECTHSHLTLFGNVMVHCERRILLRGAIHPTSGLDVAWAAVIWFDLAGTQAGLWCCGWQTWCILRKCERQRLVSSRVVYLQTSSRCSPYRLSLCAIWE